MDVHGSATTHASLPQPRELLIANYGHIQRIIRATARRGRLSESDQQDFESRVWEALVDGDYRILRQFQGRSTLSTYVHVVVQRLLIDYRTSKWGKWRSSAATSRRGPQAIAFDRLVRRDGVPEHVAAARLGLSGDAAQLHEPRPMRAVEVPTDLATLAALPAGMTADANVRRRDLRAGARHATSSLTAAVRRLTRRERELLRLRYAAGLTVPAIATRVGADAKSLYRAYDQLLRRLRTRLEAAGLTRQICSSVCGAPDAVIEGVLATRDPGETW